MMTKKKTAQKTKKGTSSGKKHQGGGEGAGGSDMSNSKTSNRNQETVHSDVEKVTDEK